MIVHLHTVFVDKHRVRMGLVLTHKSVSLSLPASFLPASVRYGSRSKLQQRWFTFSLSPPALFSSCPPSFSDFVLCLFLPLSLSLSVLLTNWAIAFWEMSHHPAARCSLSTRAYTHTSEYLQSSVTPFLSFSVSSPAVLSSLTVFFFCLILMFSDGED